MFKASVKDYFGRDVKLLQANLVAIYESVNETFGYVYTTKVFKDVKSRYWIEKYRYTELVWYGFADVYTLNQFERQYLDKGAKRVNAVRVF